MYTYEKPGGWTVLRDGTPILALPPETPELVVQAIVATIEHEVEEQQ